MDNIHDNLFNAYAALCFAISEQVDLMAKDNDPAVQLQRARVVRKLAQAVSYLGNPVVVAEDMVRAAEESE